MNTFGKSIALITRLARLAVNNRRGLREVCGVSLALTEHYLDPAIDVLPLPMVLTEDLVGDAAKSVLASIHVFPQERYSISLAEACALALLVQKAKARNVFEFGTYRGVSTAQLAANIPAEGKVWTLDLPPDDKRTQFDINHPAQKELANLRQKGDLIPQSLLGRIEFLFQDSAHFDPSPYKATMDFVFVDGAHTAEYVANDSEKAWTMLRSGGIVAWHDCRPQNPDVVKYLRSCRFKPSRVNGTTLAFAIKA